MYCVCCGWHLVYSHIGGLRQCLGRIWLKTCSISSVPCLWFVGFDRCYFIPETIALSVTYLTYIVSSDCLHLMLTARCNWYWWSSIFWGSVWVLLQSCWPRWENCNCCGPGWWLLEVLVETNFQFFLCDYVLCRNLL